jgi:hypothetical protein
VGDAMRTGIRPGTPPAANPHRTWTARVDGDVYAEPLVLGSMVIVATERNSAISSACSKGYDLRAHHRACWRRHALTVTIGLRKLGSERALGCRSCGDFPGGVGHGATSLRDVLDCADDLLS